MEELNVSRPRHANPLIRTEIFCYLNGVIAGRKFLDGINGDEDIEKPVLSAT